MFTREFPVSPVADLVFDYQCWIQSLITELRVAITNK